MSTPALLTVEEVERLLTAVIEAAAHFPPGRVIVESKAGPRPPEGSYCSLWWKSLEPLPQNCGDYSFEQQGNEAAPEGESDPLAPALTQYLANESWCTVRVSFWGKGAFSRAAATIGALQNDERWFDLWRVLGYGGIETLHDSSAPWGGRVQERTQFDLSFYAALGAAYPVDWFDTSLWRIAAQKNTERNHSPEEPPNLLPEAPPATPAHPPAEEREFTVPEGSQPCP